MVIAAVDPGAKVRVEPPIVIVRSADLLGVAVWAAQTVVQVIARMPLAAPRRNLVFIKAPASSGR
jgi:hypothetical protein